MKLPMPRALCTLAVGLALSACQPESPPVDKPVEPQVGVLAEAAHGPLSPAVAVERAQA